LTHSNSDPWPTIYDPWWPMWWRNKKYTKDYCNNSHSYTNYIIFSKSSDTEQHLLSTTVMQNECYQTKMPQSFTPLLRLRLNKRCVLWFLIARGEFDCVCENTYMGHGSTDTDPWPIDPLPALLHVAIHKQKAVHTAGVHIYTMSFSFPFRVVAQKLHVLLILIGFP